MLQASFWINTNSYILERKGEIRRAALLISPYPYIRRKRNKEKRRTYRDKEKRRNKEIKEKKKRETQEREGGERTRGITNIY